MENSIQSQPYRYAQTRGLFVLSESFCWTSMFFCEHPFSSAQIYSRGENNGAASGKQTEYSRHLR